jgi:hypothetical protein
MKAQFLAEVANHVFEIGFAVRFIQLSETQWQYIEDLVESVKNRAKR